MLNLFWMETYSELRRNIVTGEWVVIATGRAKRPQEFSKDKKIRFKQSKEDCPFENVHEDALVVYAAGGQKPSEKWWVQVVSNNYPAFSRRENHPQIQPDGIYEKMEGVGFHEVVVTADHDRSIAKMTNEEVELIMLAYQDRFLAIKQDQAVKYISVFHNSGKTAGASISHPHSQIIGIPVIPTSINRSLRGSEKYYQEKNECVHCAIIRQELEAKTRIIYENDSYVVMAPYASKTAFETKIFPKKHFSYFEDIGVEERHGLAQALRIILAKLYKGLKNPDYNFFIHTAPLGRAKDYPYYHWHVEVLPKTAIWAGFEISTGIEICVISPEAAAEFLKNIKIRK